MLGMKWNSDALSRKLRNYVKNKMSLNYLVWALRVEKPPTIIKRWPQSHSHQMRCIAHVKLPESQRGSYAVQR